MYIKSLDNKFYSLYFVVLRVDPEVGAIFQRLREHVEKTLERSAYQNVKLTEIFRKMMPAQNGTMPTKKN